MVLFLVPPSFLLSPSPFLFLDSGDEMIYTPDSAPFIVEIEKDEKWCGKEKGMAFGKKVNRLMK